jgi:putative sterol carrier protein
MGIKLPSEADEWIAAWAEKLTESEEYSDVGEGWGVGFDGSFLFHIRPDDTYDGDDLYLYVDLEDGVASDPRVLDDEGEVGWGFAYRGDYGAWKALIHREIGAIDGLMDGKFDLDGDMQKVLQYSNAAVVMTEKAAEVDTDFEY